MGALLAITGIMSVRDTTRLTPSNLRVWLAHVSSQTATLDHVPSQYSPPHNGTIRKTPIWLGENPERSRSGSWPFLRQADRRQDGGIAARTGAWMMRKHAKYPLPTRPVGRPLAPHQVKPLAGLQVNMPEPTKSPVEEMALALNQTFATADTSQSMAELVSLP